MDVCGVCVVFGAHVLRDDGFMELCYGIDERAYGFMQT